MNRWFGVIDSMTRDERRNPTRIIDQSRRRRIATGAGVEPREVKELVESFDVMARMMKDMAGKGMRERMKMVKQMQQDAMTNPNGQLSAKKKGTGKRLSSKERFKLKKLRDKELRRRRREGKTGSTS